MKVMTSKVNVRAPLMERPMSRRSMLSALGFAGAALAEHFLKGPLARTAFGQGAPAVTDAVYGDDDKIKPPLLMNMSYIIAVTLAELRGMEEPREDLIYFVTDPDRRGISYMILQITLLPIIPERLLHPRRSPL